MSVMNVGSKTTSLDIKKTLNETSRKKLEDRAEIKQNCILKVNKPKGVSSSDVIRIIKSTFKSKKIGHGGTLDPMAEGVLPILFNEATKLSDIMHLLPKTYFFSVDFGYTTDTMDLEGNVTDKNNEIPNESDLKNVLKDLIGINFQVPQKFSACKVNGKRAYELSREGKEVILKPKEINIFTIDLLEYSCANHDHSRSLDYDQSLDSDTNSDKTIQTSECKAKACFRVSCSSGTYVRSLAAEIASKLGCLCCVTKIYRENHSFFNYEDCLDLSEYITTKDFSSENTKEHLKEKTNSRNIKNGGQKWIKSSKRKTNPYRIEDKKLFSVEMLKFCVNIDDIDFNRSNTKINTCTEQNPDLSSLDIEQKLVTLEISTEHANSLKNGIPIYLSEVVSLELESPEKQSLDNILKKITENNIDNNDTNYTLKNIIIKSNNKIIGIGYISGSTLFSQRMLAF
ncbi:tRNA pseudouridine(55) synthase TruB [Candidatus Nesciobacter abundans]|uniref:tRNA pseudouridine synthase B n=1 Tax=Candidatus Nesciobacter abundans TaxID=2601668 RepID=A0A5C0UGN1_9PROT|nr:tRNA pseudouridine(55) synthase TruB [Candidatus Nesciobacter abundans]QEK38867.1 tRNA pseudouridine(55) synthase TruB [Candidatus Nesciobacter abundans]